MLQRSRNVLSESASNRCEEHYLWLHYLTLSSQPIASYTPTHFLRPPMILIFVECCLHKQLIYGIEGALKLLYMNPLERSDHQALLTVMAEGRVKQVLENEITCALCLDLFKEPKRLPCDHVYCKDCLRGLALQSLNATISCPECRTLTQVPGNDVNNLPTAFQINRLIEAFQQVATNTSEYGLS